MLNAGDTKETEHSSCPVLEEELAWPTEGERHRQVIIRLRGMNALR